MPCEICTRMTLYVYVCICHSKDPNLSSNLPLKSPFLSGIFCKSTMQLKKSPNPEYFKDTLDTCLVSSVAVVLQCCCSVVAVLLQWCWVCALNIYATRSTVSIYANHCNTLQHTATHCNTTHTATRCNTLQHVATHCNTTHRQPQLFEIRHRTHHERQILQLQVRESELCEIRESFDTRRQRREIVIIEMQRCDAGDRVDFCDKKTL